MGQRLTDSELQQFRTAPAPVATDDELRTFIAAGTFDPSTARPDDGPKQSAAAAILTGAIPSFATGAGSLASRIGEFAQAPLANTEAAISGLDAAIGGLVPDSWRDQAVTRIVQERAQHDSEAARQARRANAESNPVAGAAKALQDAGDSAQQYWQGKLADWSPETVRQMQAVQHADGFWDTAKAMATNPAATLAFTEQSLPDMVAGMGASSVAGKLTARLLAGSAAKIAAQAERAALQSGMSADAAKAAGQSAAQHYVQSTAGSVAGNVAAASEGASSASQNRQQVQQQIEALPFDMLQRNSPRYRDLVFQQGKTPKEARTMLANELGDQASLAAGAWTFGMNKATGASEALAKTLLEHKLSPVQFAARTAKEAAGEGLQNPGENFAQYRAQVQADPTQAFDLGGSIAQGLVTGGAMGAAVHGTGLAGSIMDKSGPADAAPSSAPPAPSDGPDVSVSFPGSDQPAGAAGNAPASANDMARLVELDTIAQRRDLTPAEASEADTLLGGLTPENPAPPPKPATVDNVRDVPTIKGAATTFSTDNGAKLDGQYALVDAAHLVTSHDEDLRTNEAFPQELQPRNRENAASRMQVSNIVQRFDPARLGLSADAATGSPIIGADGIVESGNARTIALKRIYSAKGQKAEDYRDFLRNNAASFGLNPADVDNLQQPVLVRVRQSNVDRAEFARQANGMPIAQMSPSELAKSDAQRMTSLDGLQPDDGGDFTNMASRDFIRGFMSKLPATEQAGMVDANGNLSTAGYARVRNAVLAKAYGDSPTLQRMTESLDDNLRNVSRALLRVAPDVAKARSAIASGDLHDADLAPHLLSAVDEFSKLKEQGMPVQAALSQQGMFGEDMHPITRDMLQFLDENIRRPNRIAALVQSYYEHLAAQGHPAQESLLGPAEPPAVGDLFAAARDGTRVQADAAAAAARRNATSSEGAPDRGSSAAGSSAEPSSDSLNTLPSGNRTQSSPEKSATNLQLSGNTSGTFIDSPPSDSIISPADRLEQALRAANTQTFAAGGFTFEQDGRSTKVLHHGEQVASISGRRTRDAVAKAIRSNLADARSRVTPEAEAVPFSRTTPIVNANQRTQLFTALARFDDAFQYPTPKSKALADIAQEIDPGYRVQDKSKSFAESQTQGKASKAWEITVPGSDVRSGYVYESPTGNVWLDVSRLRPFQDAGTKVYAMVGAYAHNNGKVFVGDPAGLSPIAFGRRLENMVSSALKYGTTDHLQPHAAQITPGTYYRDVVDSPEFARQVAGMGLDWKDGDFGHNLAQMLGAAYALHAHFAPEIEHTVYDFAKHQFVHADTGEARPASYFRNLSQRVSGGGQARYRAGSATLARAALVNTLVRGQGPAQRRHILAGLGAQLQRDDLDPALRGIFYSRAGATGSTPAARAQDVADRMTRTWHNAPAVVVVRDMQDARVPKVVRDYDALQRSRGANGEPEGFFHGGKAYLVASQIKTDADVARVLAHEVLGHAGLRGKFGPDLDAVLDQIVTARRGAVAAKAKEYGLSDSKADLQAAAEEVLADLAATQPQIGFVRRAVAAIRTWLRQHGLDLKLSDDEIIRNFILPARGWVQRQAGAASDTDGPVFSRATKAGDADQANAERPASRLAQRAKDLVSPDRLDSLIYNFQDKFVDLRRLKEHIEQIGGTVNDLNDAYLGEELYHGKVAKRTADFLGEELRPLLTKANALNITLPELESYLHARHAPEANRVLAKRNPNQAQIDAKHQAAQADVTALERQLSRARAKGGATQAIEQALEQARAELHTWATATPFKGSEADRMALSGLSDEQAQQIMDGLAPGKKPRLEQLADMVDAINAKTLDESRRYGLRDQATIDAFKATYQHYVPLHRDEAHPDTVSHPIGMGFSVKGESGKRRVGSNAKVTNILAHVAMQREATITRGEKNAVAKQLYMLAKQNPAPDWWTVERPPVQRTMGRNGLVVETVDAGYKNRDNVVVARIAGKDAAIVFNEHNPRAVRLAAALKNLDASQVGAVLGAVGKVTRYFSAINTQYNPVFGAVNIARDAQAGLLNLSTTEIRGRQAEVAKHIPAALAGIYADLRSRSKTGRSTHSKWADLFEDFQNNGGQTGYRDLFRDPGDRAKALATEFEHVRKGQATKLARGVAHWLSDYNEALENSVRLAAYKVALDHGVTKPRAASLAKNLTVNFNRKGAKTTQLGSLYAFFNASLQGSERLVRTLRGPAGRTIITGGLMLGGLQALLGMALMGGDEWDKIPDFIRERNLILPVGPMLGDGKGYVSIPMPLGFHVLPNIGRLMTEAIMGHRSAGDAALNIAASITDAFDPLGGNAPLAQIGAPTVLDPAMALLQNKDWTGRAIYRDNFNSLDPTPGTQRSKAGASALGMALADAFNKVTGGTDYTPGAFSPTADQIDYIIGQVTGGVGRELQHLDQTGTALVSGDELPPYRIPLVGRFYGSTAGQSGQAQAFYDNVTELNTTYNEIVGRAKDGKDRQHYMDTHPLAKLGPGTPWSTMVSKLRKAKQMALERGDKQAAKGLDDQITQAMVMLNQRVEQAQRQGADGMAAP